MKKTLFYVFLMGGLSLHAQTTKRPASLIKSSVANYKNHKTIDAKIIQSKNASHKDAAAPENDNCEDVVPTVMTNGQPVTFHGTTLGGTASDHESEVLGYGAVWEAITLTGECNNLTIDYCGTPYGNMLNAFIDYQISCDSGEFVYGDWDDYTCPDGNFTIRFQNVPAGTYYIPVIIDPDYNVLGDYTLNVLSVDCPPPPSDCEDFQVSANDMPEGSLFFGGENNQRLAVDIPMQDQPFTIYGIHPTTEEQATNFEFNIYSDQEGLPGELLSHKVGTIQNEQLSGTISGHNFYEYAVMFDSPFEFEAHKTYWIETVTDAVGWEMTSMSDSRIGEPTAGFNDLTNGWVSSQYYESVFGLICDYLGTTNVKTSNLSFYPNPVKDVLNISADQKITSVSLYNVAGQKVINNVKADDRKINVSRLVAGTYIVTAILENGKTETFKVIKK